MKLEKFVDLGSNKYIITNGTLDDVESCVNAFSLILDEIQDFPENDLIYSENNVALFRKLITESIKLGYPPIITNVIINNEISSIGFCLIIKLFGFESKYQSAQALGSYVYQKHRSLGLSRLMLEAGFELYKQLGIQKIYGKTFESRAKSNEVITNLDLERVTVLCKNL